MIRTDLVERVRAAVQKLILAGQLPNHDYACEVVETKSAEHGDFATNFALTASKISKIPPPKIGAMLAEVLEQDEAFDSVSLAGPGFVNLTLATAYLLRYARLAFEYGEAIAQTESDVSRRVLIEFVSVNPNGPIHCGHGRGAAYGDTLARLMTASGHEVRREYYVNDGVNSQQMVLFAESVKARYREILGLPFEFPENGYKGEYVFDVARLMRERFGDVHADSPIEFWQPKTQEMMIEAQREDLERFGVRFDQWFSEQSLHDSGAVTRDLDLLKSRGELFEQDGAWFLRSTSYGDDKDRVVIRADGRPTYIASDIAYHKEKFDRGYDLLIDVWGADHHGYIARTSAAVQAFGYGADQFEAIITQIVRFYENGRVVEMSKRDGTMVTLRELMNEVGTDVARFFYLMRSHDAHMEFDLGLAKEHSDKNPVYYVQYAHARICSLLARAADADLSADVEKLVELSAPERALVKKIWDLPFEVQRAAADRAVHRITTYAVELARTYHDFYEKCRVIDVEQPDVSAGRLSLCVATLSSFRATFELLGISAPEKM